MTMDSDIAMKIIFLDRDGVISKFTPDDYVKKWEEFEFLPGAIEGLKILFNAGYKIVIISNQAGIRKGLFTEEDLEEVTNRMLNVLKKENIHIEKIYYCIHTDEDNCECRKPKPGLFFRANEEICPVEFSGTFFIGDHLTDIEAGKNAGTKTILLLSGRTVSEDEIKDWEVKPDFIAKNLKEAVHIVLRENE